MRTAHFLPIFGLALFNAAATALAAPYAVVSETTTVHPLPIIGELRLTDTVIQDGPIALNRFRMHRLRRPNIIPQGAVLLMPSLGNSFRGYLTHETGDLTKSFAAVLARAGYEVWGYSPRETGLAPGACGVTLDCSPALDWSIKTVIEDATYIRSRIKSIFPAKDPVIGGLSLGAITAIAVVNEHPKHYAGLLAWEGSPVTSDAAVMAHNAGFCAQYNVLVGAGVASGATAIILAIVSGTAKAEYDASLSADGTVSALPQSKIDDLQGRANGGATGALVAGIGAVALGVVGVILLAGN